MGSTQPQEARLKRAIDRIYTEYGDVVSVNAKKKELRK